MAVANRKDKNLRQMSLIKKYRIIFFIALPLLILLAARIFTPGSFKYDAKKWAEPSFSGANVIGTTEFENLSGKKIIVNLDRSFTGLAGKSVDEVLIPPDSLLSKKYLDKIKDHNGPVLIASSDLSLSARIWMVISQTGSRNLYILSGKDDNEAFKSEFRPDTTVKPEF
jgi:hypothetical protein